ncbi:MAG: hypothetical protein H5U40_04855 [Polyangiaceae bacterium]|nr:hypothetical protein [Polyangiaceae bacterium]
MEPLNEKLKESADRLVAQGTSFLAITRGAGEGFVSRTRSAGEQFWAEAVEASGELFTQTKEAQKELVGSVQGEADALLSYFRAEDGKLRLEGIPKKLKAPSALENAKVPNVRELEKRLLLGISDALQGLETKVHQRIQILDTVALPATTGGTIKKTGAAPKKNGAAKKASLSEEVDVATKAAPLAGYDDLTAREVMAKLQKLDKKKVEELLDYEQDTKNRATVVNAMRARLEA